MPTTLKKYQYIYKIIVLRLVCVFICVCSHAGTEDIGTITQKLVQSPKTNAVFWSVRLSLSGVSCTGSALTDNWIVTSVHCIDDSNSANGQSFAYISRQGYSLPSFTQ